MDIYIHAFSDQCFVSFVNCSKSVMATFFVIMQVFLTMENHVDRLSAKILYG